MQLFVSIIQQLITVIVKKHWNQTQPQSKDIFDILRCDSAAKVWAYVCVYVSVVRDMVCANENVFACVNLCLMLVSLSTNYTDQDAVNPRLWPRQQTTIDTDRKNIQWLPQDRAKQRANHPMDNHDSRTMVEPLQQKVSTRLWGTAYSQPHRTPGTLGNNVC